MLEVAVDPEKNRMISLRRLLVRFMLCSGKQAAL